MSLKNCPFCGGEATMIRHAGLSVSVRCMNEECKMPSVGINYCDEAEAITAWNTRAAPTMKPWVWSEGDGAAEVEACLDFKAFVYRNKGETMWTAYVGVERVAMVDTIDAAQAACVAYVEGKLKEWLVS